MPICTALIVAAAAYYAPKGGNGDAADGSGSSDDDAGDITAEWLEGKTACELLPLEQTLNILEWPTTTVTFFSCASPEKMHSALDGLERRLAAMLRANPWLGGWLVRGKGVGSSCDNTLRLWYDPTKQEVAPEIFRRMAHDDVPLDKDTPYADYEKILLGNDVAVKTNIQLINRKAGALFRVTVVPTPFEDGFALVVSMSHALGDGYTYYGIYKMLLGNRALSALIPQRELMFSSQVMELMGRQEAHYISHITTDPAWAKLFRLGSGVSAAEEEGEGSELQGRVFLINRHFIANIKAQHLTEGNISDIYKSTLRSPMTPAALNDLDSATDDSPTLSTNSILVSWFWNLLNVDVGLMTDHVGNYANPVPYTREDYKSPALIRKSLENCRRAGTAAGTGAATTLPRAHPELTFSIVTNWSSFRHTEQNDVNREADTEWNDGHGVTLLRHLPVIFPRMKDESPKRMSFLVIFSSGPDDIGCVVLAPGRAMEEIERCGVVKEMIAEF
ncbi:hypothetical protein ACHAXT_005100 [Thalassiosira profunda]